MVPPTEPLLPTSCNHRWRVYHKASCKKNGDLFNILKNGWQHHTLITFSISQMLNIIVRLKGDYGIEHSIGIARIRKLGMAFERYSGASQGSINTLI